jgi:pimeloyl-ACP methyl ester carboxylesterase
LTRAPAGYQLAGPGLADFVDAFAARLALPKFAVAGNSMGGGAAWQLAVRHPDRINALMLVDAAGWHPKSRLRAFRSHSGSCSTRLGARSCAASTIAL